MKDRREYLNSQNHPGTKSGVGRGSKSDFEKPDPPFVSIQDFHPQWECELCPYFLTVFVFVTRFLRGSPFSMVDIFQRRFLNHGRIRNRFL
jgi:hypothetical protein